MSADSGHFQTEYKTMFRSGQFVGRGGLFLTGTSTTQTCLHVSLGSESSSHNLVFIILFVQHQCFLLLLDL